MKTNKNVLRLFKKVINNTILHTFNTIKSLYKLQALNMYKKIK